MFGEQTLEFYRGLLTGNTKAYWTATGRLRAGGLRPRTKISLGLPFAGMDRLRPLIAWISDYVGPHI